LDLGDGSSSLGLLRCVLASQRSRGKGGDGGFVLLSWLSPHIHSYAAYTALINAAYAERRGYSFELLGPGLKGDEENEEEEEEDLRWKKVGVLIEATERHKDGAYLVWLDSDLAVLDFDSLVFEATVDAHPHADILLSRDARPENGIANTGCIVVRNTAFTRAFLRLWSSSFPHSDAMDQHALHRLWAANALNITAHMALLPPDAINSDVPWWETHGPQNPILHLAGLSAVRRAAIFAPAASVLCAALQAAEPEQVPPLQLGVTRAALTEAVLGFSVARAAGERLLKRALSLAASLSPLSSLSSLSSISVQAGTGTGTGTEAGAGTGAGAEAEVEGAMRELRFLQAEARDLRQRGYGFSPSSSPPSPPSPSSSLSGAGEEEEAGEEADEELQWAMVEACEAALLLLPLPLPLPLGQEQEQEQGQH